MSGTNHTRFQELLLRYSQEPDPVRRKEIETTLWADFGTERAVLVLDMSGFSQLTLRYGVVHYLSMVRRMQLTTLPIVQSYGGKLVKFEADNCFAMFPDAAAAVRSAIALNLAFDAANFLTPDELDIKIAVGIDYGPILVIDDQDFFGHPVNRASKLGEDLAGPGEILVTREAMERVTDQSGFQFKPMSLTVSGIAFDACAVSFRVTS